MGAAVITAGYAVVVTWAAANHEPWRDEVVPLSIARAARSLADLAAPLKFEGHPILWYLLIWCGYGLVGRTWVLKAASVGSALGAVFLVNRSALPWWVRLAFSFSFFPLYQYSVISRGYSLEMLLLFAFCALHPHRGRRPLAIALLLGALANTEAFGLIMAVAAGAMLAVESVASGSWRRLRSDRRVQGAVVVFVCALMLATAVAFPDAGHRGTGVRQLDLSSVAVGVGRAILQPAGHVGSLAIVPLPSLWVWGYFLYLSRRPPVLCFAAIALVGIEVLFNLVHGPGAAWHLGNSVLVIVAAMWLDASATGPIATAPRTLGRARMWLGWVLTAGVAIMLIGQVRLAVQHLDLERRYEYSSNRALAALLAHDPTLTGAVVMGEPDLPLWSLPYYADNRIYLAREDAYRAWGMFAPPRRVDYDLGALLAAARRVRGECACPVVVTMGWDLGQAGTAVNFAGSRFEEHFVISPDARAEFLAATRRVASLLGPTITDERYEVYVLDAPGLGSDEHPPPGRPSG